MTPCGTSKISALAAQSVRGVTKCPEEGLKTSTADNDELANCLPFLPPSDATCDSSERTYRALLGPLGGVPTVSAVNPLADIAVLGPPDDQIMAAEAEAFEELVASAVPLSIADTSQSGSARLLSLDCRWFECVVTNHNGTLWIDRPAEHIVGRMSGSPIAADDGYAIGVLCNSAIGEGEEHVPNGTNPALTDQLPGWLLHGVGADTRRLADEHDPVIESAGTRMVPPILTTLSKAASPN